MTAPTSLMTMDEFLALPERKPYREYLRGEVSEKCMPNRRHAALVALIVYELVGYLRNTGEGRVYTELRHAWRPGNWVFLPDVSVTLRGRLDTQAPGPETVMPDFAIEVLSPDDRASDLFERVELYMRAGTRLLWIVNPDNESITAYRPGEVTTVHRVGETIGARPVLSEFALDLGALFATAREG